MWYPEWDPVVVVVVVALALVFLCACVCVFFFSNGQCDLRTKRDSGKNQGNLN